MPEWLLQTGIALFAATIGWFGRRWLTGEKTKEEASSLSTTVDLIERLRRLGLSIDDVRQFREDITAGRRAITPVVAQQLTTAFSESPSDEDLEYAQTTVEISGGLARKLSYLEEELEAAAGVLLATLPEGRALKLNAAQSDWFAFRESEAEFAASIFEGGTAQPLVAVSKKIELTEQRLVQLRLTRAEEDAL